MVDHLNTANRQSLPIDVASSLRKLEAMLSQGQSRTAQVVQVTPQLATGTPAQAGTTQPSIAQSGSPQPNPAPPSTAATATLAGTNTAIAPSSATVTNPTGAPPQPPSSTELFRIQVRLEGRLFDLITQKPLPPGSEVQISKDGGNRISLQLTTTTGQQAATNPTGDKGAGTAANLSNAIPSNRVAGNQANNAAAQVRATQATNTAGQSLSQPGQRAATAATTTQPPLTTGSNVAPPKGVSTNPSAQPSTPPSTQSAAAQTNSSSRIAATANPATVERIALQAVKAELPIRPGQRISVQVISSQPNPAALTTTPPAQSVSPTIAQSAVQQPAANTTSDSQLIRINIQGQRTELVSPRPLPPGSELQLVRDNKGQLWAELPTARTKAIEQVLREHLPQQQSPAPLLNLLNSSQASGQLQQAKPLLLNLITLLTGRSLSSPQKADAESVKQQVQNSGTLLESKLAQGDTRNLGQDHKALLLRLAHQLGQPSTQSELPKTLSEQITQQTQQALSRVLVNQITSSLGGQTQETGTESSRTLALDIPVAWQDKTENLQLKIQRDASGTDEETGEMEYRWRIRLNFEIDQNKLLEAELTLEQNRVSVIWSGDSHVRDRVERKLDQLQQRLEDIGLEVQTLGVRDNLPTNETGLKAPRNQLIDIKT